MPIQHDKWNNPQFARVRGGQQSTQIRHRFRPNSMLKILAVVEPNGFGTSNV